MKLALRSHSCINNTYLFIFMMNNLCLEYTTNNNNDDDDDDVDTDDVFV